MKKNISNIEIPVNGVIQSPGGEIQFYTEPTKKIKNKNNPYLKHNILHAEEDNNNSIEVIYNGNTIIISRNRFNKAINLECKAIVVRYFCMIDFVTNIFYIPTNNYLAVSSSLFALISLAGIYSTCTYNRLGILTYLIYQYTLCIAKITTVSIYIVALNNQNYQFFLHKEYNIIINPTIELTILYSVIVLVQICITGFIQHFYNLIPTRRYIPLNSMV